MKADPDLHGCPTACLPFPIEEVESPEHLQARLMASSGCSGNKAITASPTNLSMTPPWLVIAGSMAPRYSLTNWNVSPGDIGSARRVKPRMSANRTVITRCTWSPSVDVHDALLAELLEELARHEAGVAVADLGELQVNVDPRQQFVAGKGLRQVVVGPGTEATHQIRDAVAGGQQDHRQVGGRPCLADALADGKPRDVRHHHVEQNEVAGMARRQEVQGLLPGGGRGHLVVCEGKVVDQRLHVDRLVVDHEDVIAAAARRAKSDGSSRPAQAARRPARGSPPCRLRREGQAWPGWCG